MSTPQPVYLDYNGTTPVDPEVLEAMLPFLGRHFGNPSSQSLDGEIARSAVNEARRQVAALIGAAEGEVLFTSGGTESNNHAILGAARQGMHRGRHIVTTAIEHPAVLEVCRHLEENGDFEVTRLPVDEHGRISPDAVGRAIRSDTVLVSVMHANNEVGTLQPIAEIGAIARQRGVFFHCDAAQSLGKVPVDVGAMRVDFLSIAGHKLYAPKGTGALYIRDGVVLPRFMHGAGQESGRRGGTENVAGWVALGKACEIAARDFARNTAQMQRTRDQLHEGLRREFPNLVLNGHPKHRLPNTLSVAFPGLNARTILASLRESVSASAGAACHSDSTVLSHVLRAIGVSEELGKAIVRFSTGKNTSPAEIHRALEAITSSLSPA